MVGSRTPKNFTSCIIIHASPRNKPASIKNTKIYLAHKDVHIRHNNTCTLAPKTHAHRHPNTCTLAHKTRAHRHKHIQLQNAYRDVIQLIKYKYN